MSGAERDIPDAEKRAEIAVVFTAISGVMGGMKARTHKDGVEPAEAHIQVRVKNGTVEDQSEIKRKPHQWRQAEEHDRNERDNSINQVLAYVNAIGREEI